jgi:hypothetical protein
MSSYAMLGSNLLDDEKESENDVKSGVSSRPDSQFSRDENDLIGKLPGKLKEFVNNHKNKEMSSLLGKLAKQLPNQKIADVNQNL